jgi:hypothetical protein
MKSFKLDMSGFNCVLLVVILVLVIMCCMKKSNEDFFNDDFDTYPLTLLSTGEFLAEGENDELDSEIAIHAVGTPGMEAALTDYSLGDKADDFDKQFHIKKFMGVLPDS